MTVANALTHRFTKEELKEAGEKTLTKLFEQEKESQVSVRMGKGLYKALEAQTKVWKYKNVSQTVRTILSFYFLPAVYELEWKDKEPSDFKRMLNKSKEQGFSLEHSRMNYFLRDLVEYQAFLEEAQRANHTSLKYLERTIQSIYSIIEEAQEKMVMAIEEIEQEKRE